MHPFYEDIIAQAKAAIRAGGGSVTIQGVDQWVQTGQEMMVANAIRMVTYHAKQRRYEATVEKEGGKTTVHLVKPAGWVEERGAQKSEMRVEIEGLEPGQFLAFHLDNTDHATRIRNTIQSIRVAHPGRRFTTSSAQNGSVLMVTRIDGVSDADRVKHENDQWPFRRLDVGQSELVQGANSWSARNAAAYHRERYGKRFKFEKTGDGVIITRVL